MTSATVLAADAVVTRIGSGAWAAGAPDRRSGGDICSSVPGFPGILAGFVSPLQSLLDLVTGEPQSVYHVSYAWEQATGDVADIRELLESIQRRIAEQLDGATANQLAAAILMIADGAHSVSNWTKVVSQALQLCVTIFEAVRALACEALLLLSRFADQLGEVVFGSWPWELQKKADAIREFAESVERFVHACTEAADSALKAARELVRLLTDLSRAIVPFHQQIDEAIGRVVNLVPGGTAPPVGPGATTGPNGAVYNPSQTPYPESELRFAEEYPLGYQHSYDLGSTDLTTEELNELFRAEFGHLFVPSRVGDNSQLNMTLNSPNAGPGQTIETSLFGTAIPGVTTGNITVQQITSDGFVIAATEGHPEYPGEVAFRLTSQNGQARLQVTGAYDETIIGRHDLGLPVDSNPAYAAISDYSIWADMQGRIQDRLQYGRG